MRRGAVGIVSLVLLASACQPAGGDLALERAPVAPPSAPVTTTTPGGGVAPATAPAPGPNSPTATTTPTSVPPAASTADRRWSEAAYHGFGAWLDAFDWSETFARAAPVGPEAVDHMAAEGVETLYLQASRWNSPTDVLEPDRLQAFIDRAHQHGIAVVAWYLPTLVDVDTDLRRMLALAALDVDGLAVDIEARDVADPAERSRRLVDLSRRLRAALPGKAIGGIVIEPVLIEDVNPGYWPGFPWAEIAPLYDAWLPMSYWTNRRGPWRSAHAYTWTNIARLRERLGHPDAVVHPIGGVGDRTTTDDLREMVTASAELGAVGGSLYDYRTSRPEFWDVLRAFRSNPG